MRYTIFDTPVVKHFFSLIAWVGLKLTGWKLDLSTLPPDNPKYILVAAPHTSNWDFIMMLAMAFRFNLKVYWMGKDSMFNHPLKKVMFWLGGVSVDRSQSNNLVSYIAQQFQAAETMVLTIPPEGTRGKGKFWKTGFYYIALEAGIPIVMTYVDYKKKIGGFAGSFMPSGDIEKDKQILIDAYKNISGRFPENFTLPNFRPRTDNSKSNKG